ncbi:3-oxoacyl-ACP synthase [Solimonas sp. K1W22B-7]|nr:3-oxoacyl-ACP synthase [Solimonas sp. K1W22B-7]
MRFSVLEWAAWGPGLGQNAAWVDWAAGAAALPAGDDKPELAELAPMARRRLDRLGRMALQVAYRVQADRAAGCPIVYASRHGSVHSSVDMLAALAAHEPLSPTVFSMSVHNAVGALYSIARGDTAPYTAVAAGRSTVEAAFVEAAGLMADGAPEVMVVVYDEPLPTVFASFGDEPEAPYAWACRLGPGVLRLQWQADAVEASREDLPHGLAVLRFLIGGAAQLDFSDGQRSWQWCRQ